MTSLRSCPLRTSQLKTPPEPPQEPANHNDPIVGPLRVNLRWSLGLPRTVRGSIHVGMSEKPLGRACVLAQYHVLKHNAAINEYTRARICTSILDPLSPD